MTASPPQVNGHARPTTPAAGDWRPAEEQCIPSRREENREDRRAERIDAREDRALEREEARRDAEHQRQLKEQERKAALELKQQKRADKEKARARRRKERRLAWLNAKARLAHHMPLWGLPVVAVSLIMGWSGQAGAAAHLGMGLFAGGVPVLTEGMVLTFAGLTGQAIDQGRPYRGLMRTTWITTIVAATINGAGHLIEDSSGPGMYRAGAYALASLAAMILWWVVMRSKRAAISGKTADEIARWKRLARRHPILIRRARRVADNTGKSMADAYATVWQRSNGAAPGEPSIREIRATQRAAFRRRRAQAWTGERSWRKRSEAPAVAVPAASASASEAPQETASSDVRTPVQAPVLPVALLVPGPQGEWVTHPVPVRPLGPSAGFRTRGDRTATTRFPQGKGALSKRVREDVTDDRLAAVRKLVAEAAAKNEDLRKHPSNRAVARAVGCRPATARELLATALADRGITRTKDQ
ncbi:hypothetical protein [Streptomyces sp. NPDC058398]|uniref:hypothetical protein n=1 Tax=Streptomyces sp. NPDC058398 TaxID=3346479 RepID=UPI00365702F3